MKNGTKFEIQQAMIMARRSNSVDLLSHQSSCYKQSGQSINRACFASPPVFKKLVQLNYLFSLYFTVTNHQQQTDNIKLIKPNMMMDSYEAVPKAVNFLQVDVDTLQENLVVLPPYRDDNAKQWVRGYLKLKNNLSPTGSQDFIITGPKLKVTYSGCSWNKIVFNMDDSVAEFGCFLRQISSIVRGHIMKTPSKYKQGAVNDARFTWDETMLIKPSREPDKYSDELRCRLSTFRDMVSSSEDESTIEIPDTYFFKEMADGTTYPVLPDEICGGDSIVPVFRLSYGRNINRFFLILTLLKGKVIPSEKPIYKKIKNEDWEMDESI